MSDKPSLRELLCPNELFEVASKLLGKLDQIGEKDWYHLELNSVDNEVIHRLETTGLVEQGRLEDETIYRMTSIEKEAFAH